LLLLIILVVVVVSYRSLSERIAKLWDILITVISFPKLLLPDVTLA